MNAQHASQETTLPPKDAATTAVSAAKSAMMDHHFVQHVGTIVNYMETLVNVTKVTATIQIGHVAVVYVHVLRCLHMRQENVFIMDMLQMIAPWLEFWDTI